MLQLKNCIHCGRSIPAKIIDNRYFCGPMCHEKYFREHGDPRFRIKEFYIKDYGQARVNLEAERDSELQELFDWILPIRSKRTHRNAKFKKQFDPDGEKF